MCCIHSMFQISTKLINKMAKMEKEKGSGTKGAITDWIRLNVGGTIFETSRATLTSHPTSTLARMFDPDSGMPPATSTPDGVYLIDACPAGFSVVLNWLRYRHLMLGMVKAEDVMPLADYFGLEELQGLLGEHLVKVEKKEKQAIGAQELQTMTMV